MPLALRIMAALGVLAGMIGLPMLLRPGEVRRTFGWRETPQLVYILRIVGTMFAAMGLILLTFAFAYWRASAS